MNARQASKGPQNKTQSELAQNMMSQESIKNYVEDAEKETQKEKKRLEQQENQKKQYAKKVLMRQQVGDEDQGDAPVGSKGLTNNSL